ncbi:MAG: hypothetical protein QOF24_2935 [Verrucomicrobiota bacterium]|jgi:hypothetical protein
MSDTAPSELNDCGCCEGVEDQTPVIITNPPGLSALAYRVGTHSRFKESMEVDLTGAAPLRELKTRRDDDPTIGLIDAWATALDVLTFYQERIANEGYLRTSTERRSLLELAHSIGYELRPGVAASTYLMFTMESAEGAPRQAIISAGTKAQSVPEQDQQAQTFETIEEVVARPAWNKILPRTTRPQELKIQDDKLQDMASSAAVHCLYFKGTATGLAPGDWLVVTTGATNKTQAVSMRIARVKTDDKLERTEVEVETNEPTPEEGPAVPPDPPFESVSFPATVPPLPFTGENIRDHVLEHRWRERDLQTILQLNHWDADELVKFVNQRTATWTVRDQAVFALRERAGFFGNNALPYTSLRNRYDMPLLYPDWDKEGWSIWKPHPNLSSDEPTLLVLEKLPAKGLPVVDRPAESVLEFRERLGKELALAVQAWLERSISGIVKNSWVMFANANGQEVYRVLDALESSIAGFGMSGKTTILELSKPNGSGVTSPLPEFLVRNTTAYVKSEALELAALPIADFIRAGTTALELSEMVLGLQPGQLVVLTGEQKDAPGVIRQELLVLSEIIHYDGLTTILFREQSGGEGLLYSYLRKTVALNANVARATHGETKREVLGSGDAAQAFQKFVLKQAPLTYVPAPTPAGLASTLQLRVNDVLWEESPTLYRVPPSERTYITRRSDDAKTAAQFGDGVTGARLPSGVENVTATYRVGIGLGGMVKAKQISLLLTRSLGLKEVINPLPASGAADAETRDDARENAPFTVLTLDRIVSLQDFEDYARAYPGIGKAQAIWLWQGERKVVHLTIAGADGGPISTVSALYENLKLSMAGARDPGPHVSVASFVPLNFNVQAKLLVTRGYLTDKVRAAVSSAVLSAFSFRGRGFGQAVTKSELLAVMQGVEGVDAVDLDKLYFSSKIATLEDRLPARTADWNNAHSKVRPAELLLVNPREIQLTEMPV